MTLPENGLTRKDVFGSLEQFREGDINWREGRTFGYVFDPGPEVMEIGKEAYMMYLTENGLDFTVFQSLMKLEKALAAFGIDHLNGGDEAVGNFTSGGTESIMLAVKAARDYYRAKRSDITRPEMILPATAHAAFHKAAHYLGITVIPVSVDPDSFRADPESIRYAINENTILLVGSAPSYAHGVVDPIREIGELALEKDLWLHTDACMGGFLLPYLTRLGRPVPEFDFRVPGVSSISMDLHKYAYSPKGASLVLYRTKHLRKYQIFACSHWIGYTIINNAIQSSKSGGPMAAAWAVMNYIGDKGYLDIAQKKLEATRKIVAGIKSIPALRLLTEPDMCLVSFTSDSLNIFHLIDEMNSRGWYIQPALSFDNSPEHIHLSINASNVAWVDLFLTDLADAVEKVKNVSSGELVAAVRTGLDGMDLSGLTDAETAGLLAMAGIGGDQGLPKQMADINEILNLLPPDIREKLLTTFVNDVFVYPSGA